MPEAVYPVKTTPFLLLSRTPDSPVTDNFPGTMLTLHKRPDVRSSTSAKKTDDKIPSFAPTAQSSTSNTSCVIGGTTLIVPRLNNSMASTLKLVKLAPTATAMDIATVMATAMDSALPLALRTLIHHPVALETVVVVVLPPLSTELLVETETEVVLLAETVIEAAHLLLSTVLLVETGTEVVPLAETAIEAVRLPLPTALLAEMVMVVVLPLLPMEPLAETATAVALLPGTVMKTEHHLLRMELPVGMVM